MTTRDKTYLFYDLETTGVNPCFDQILQFAAVRTDQELNELERYEFLVKINPDIIPTAQAAITHHITIEQASTGISEYEAVKKIYQLVNTPNTMSVGYNTLSFDDKFLRFSFFRNLLPPYNHQYKEGCSRFDLYPFVVLYHLFSKETLNWPVNNKGLLSLKLEDLNAKNSLYSEGRAHDAVSDVLATLALARILKAKNLKMWQYLLLRFNKTEDKETLSLLDTGINIDNNNYTQGLMVAGHFGHKDQFMVPGLNLGQHWHYKNQWCFLRLDTTKLQEITSENIAKHVVTINKKWGDLPLLLPTKKRFLKHLSDDRITCIKDTKVFLKTNPTFFLEIKHAVLDYKYPEIDNIDIDASLYQSGFMNYAEQNLCDVFHQSSVIQKVNVIKKMPESHYRRAVRVVGRIAPDALTESMQFEFRSYLEKIKRYDNDKLIDYKGLTKVSIREVFHDIQTLRLEGNLTLAQRKILDELEDYLSV